MPNRLTEREKKRIRKLRANGHALWSIAQITGRSKSAVARVLRVWKYDEAAKVDTELSVRDALKLLHDACVREAVRSVALNIVHG